MQTFIILKQNLKRKKTVLKKGDSTVFLYVCTPSIGLFGAAAFETVSSETATLRHIGWTA